MSKQSILYVDILVIGFIDLVIGQLPIVANVSFSVGCDDQQAGFLLGARYLEVSDLYFGCEELLPHGEVFETEDLDCPV